AARATGSASARTTTCSPTRIARPRGAGTWTASPGGWPQRRLRASSRGRRDEDEGPGGRRGGAEVRPREDRRVRRHEGAGEGRPEVLDGQAGREDRRAGADRDEEGQAEEA